MPVLSPASSNLATTGYSCRLKLMPRQVACANYHPPSSLLRNAIDRLKVLASSASLLAIAWALHEFRHCEEWSDEAIPSSCHLRGVKPRSNLEAEIATLPPVARNDRL